jgi:DNA transformation protein
MSKKKNSGFVDYVLDQLRDLKGVTARAMFGGHGLYKEGIFFAAVAEERLFFRVSDRTRVRYEEANMPPFAPYGMKPMRSYFEVPADVLESPPRIVEWAKDAVADAKAAKTKKKIT